MSSPDTAERGYTTAELSRLLRVSPDTIRAWIRSGELGAINTAPPKSRKPRFVILPEHLEAFERRYRAATVAARSPPRRRQRTGKVDFYPD